MSSKTRVLLAILATAAAWACTPGFRISSYPTSESLFRAGVERLERRKWEHAVQAFEKLTNELPARDTLLPASYFFLAKAYAGRGDHLLAAQTYRRMAEAFATDTLADDALFQAGREYQKMWRSPSLDPLYGGEALAAYQELLGLYPDSEWADSANKQIGVLQEWFATKDYETALHYLRRKAYDSAIIYLRDVVERYPQTARARDAFLKLALAYEAIRWRDDKAEVCQTMRERYPQDREVAQVCGPAVAPGASARRPPG
jgi:outer membrane protein assembly factor BamD